MNKEIKRTRRNESARTARIEEMKEDLYFRFYAINLGLKSMRSHALSWWRHWFHITVTPVFASSAHPIRVAVLH
jgi:hypothetical protein